MSDAHVLLTGVTGFIGKLLLEDLLRRDDVAGVTVIVRPEAGADDVRESATNRFFSTVGGSPVFDRMPDGWSDRVRVLAGDLTLVDCGLERGEVRDLVEQTTHIVHCAAAINMDLPMKEAARSNITTSLNVLELAKRCARLRIMVSVSTAYVTPWREGPIVEELVRLPRPAALLHRAIEEGAVPEEALLAETGHANTYTYTKCLAEHLLAERREHVPLRIVRPSIVGPALQHPMPGWVDSPAAYAGALLLTGLGLVKAWNADPGARNDVIPVDGAVRSICGAAFAPPPGDVEVWHAVAGADHCLRMDRGVHEAEVFFSRRTGSRRKPGAFVGDRDHGYQLQNLWRQDLPLTLARAVQIKRARRRRLRKVADQARSVVDILAYFISRTYDFRTSRPSTLPDYTVEDYLETSLRGVYQYLLGNDETQQTLAGADHVDGRRDLGWAIGKRQSSRVTPVLAYGLRKALRSSTDRVTFDRTSFENAVAAAPPDALFVLAPTHRSYLDFLLTTYLTYQHPELGIPMPHIAAAEEFGKNPVMGRILQDAGAFYIPRGVGNEVPAVTDELRRVADAGGSLMIFVEGQRSRSQYVLPPKRGLLRGLQGTGKTFVILPITISYDRRPEDSALARELRGGSRSKVSVEGTARYAAEVLRGHSKLGRAHLACGEPLVMLPDTDIPALTHEVAAAFQRHATVTDYHLRMFLARTGVDVELPWLRGAIASRGGRVLDSACPTDAVEEETARSLSHLWIHWFYPDAEMLWPGCPAVRDHLARHDWRTAGRSEAVEMPDARTAEVVGALFEPVVSDYEQVVRTLAEARTRQPVPTPLGFCAAAGGAFLPHVEDAYSMLTDRGVLVRDGGRHIWGPNAEQLDLLHEEIAASPVLAGSATSPSQDLPGERRAS